MSFSGNKVRKLPSVDNWKLLAIAWPFVSVPFFVHLAEIFRAIKIRFGMKCTLDSDITTALAKFRKHCFRHHHQ